jgi:hypothetical protein
LFGPDSLGDDDLGSSNDLRESIEFAHDLKSLLLPRSSSPRLSGPNKSSAEPFILLSELETSISASETSSPSSASTSPLAEMPGEPVATTWSSAQLEDALTKREDQEEAEDTEVYIENVIIKCPEQKGDSKEEDTLLNVSNSTDDEMEVGL